jgi:hypothetical protein
MSPSILKDQDIYRAVGKLYTIEPVKYGHPWDMGPGIAVG